MESVDVEGQHQPENPYRANRGRQDDRAHAGLALDPGAILGRPYRGLLVINIEPRQQEQTRHPEDDKGDVRGLDPRVGEPEPSGQIAHLPPFTTAISCST